MWYIRLYCTSQKILNVATNGAYNYIALTWQFNILHFFITSIQWLFLHTSLLDPSILQSQQIKFLQSPLFSCYFKTANPSYIKSYCYAFILQNLPYEGHKIFCNLIKSNTMDSYVFYLSISHYHIHQNTF